MCCKLGGDIITRHNRLRDVVAAVAEEGGLNPLLEKKGILGHTDKSQRRPAEVAIPTWSMGKGRLFGSIQLLRELGKLGLAKWFGENIGHVDLGASGAITYEN